MLALINRILDWFKSLFWKEEMELTLVGLQYSGKTTFVNVIAVSIFSLYIGLNICFYDYDIINYIFVFLCSHMLLGLSHYTDKQTTYTDKNNIQVLCNATYLCSLNTLF